MRPSTNQGWTISRLGSRSAADPPGAATSLERIDWIIGLDDDPVRRNLLITQCYHDLSTQLARVLGGGNANWCTFATWASRTAGGFIREDEIPAAFRLLLGRFTPLHITLARANAALACCIETLPGVMKRHRDFP